MRILHSLLLFASLLAVSYCVSHEELLDKYRFNSRLSPSYTIYWNFDIEKENISIAVRARTEGWVGFGLSRNGQMPYSDVVIGWVNGYNQKTFFEVSQEITVEFDNFLLQDRYAWGRYEPSIDEEQNWFLLNGDEEYGYTTLQFTRNFTTCDEITDLDITVINHSHLLSLSLSLSLLLSFSHWQTLQMFVFISLSLSLTVWDCTCNGSISR